MIDINLLREGSKEVAKLLKQRGFDLDILKYESLEKDRKVIQVKAQELQGQRNQFSKNIGIEKGKGNDAWVSNVSNVNTSSLSSPSSPSVNL